MTAHKDEGILMQTVTPPVLVLPGEGSSRAASLAFGHLVPALALAEAGKGRDTLQTAGAKNIGTGRPNSGLALVPIWQRALGENRNAGKC